MKPCVPNFSREVRETTISLLLLFDDVQPTEPLVFVTAGPEGCVTRPQPLDFAICLPIIERSFNSLRQVGRQRKIQLIDLCGDEQLLAFYGALAERAWAKVRRLSVYGARATPRSVMMASIISCGVTSKAKLCTSTPSGVNR